MGSGQCPVARRMDSSDWINAGTAAITLGGLIAVFFQLRGLNRQTQLQSSSLESLNQQTRLQSFAEYTRRYAEIVLKFPEDIDDGSFVLNKERKDYDDVMRYMRAYYDLCFEEWYLHGKGDIGDDYWDIWRTGMKTAFSKPAFQQAWFIMQSYTNFGSDFRKFVAELTEEPRSEPRI